MSSDIALAIKRLSYCLSTYTLEHLTSEIIATSIYPLIAVGIEARGCIALLARVSFHYFLPRVNAIHVEAAAEVFRILTGGQIPAVKATIQRVAVLAIVVFPAYPCAIVVPVIRNLTPPRCVVSTAAIAVNI